MRGLMQSVAPWFLLTNRFPLTRPPCLPRTQGRSGWVSRTHKFYLDIQVLRIGIRKESGSKQMSQLFVFLHRKSAWTPLASIANDISLKMAYHLDEGQDWSFPLFFSALVWSDHFPIVVSHNDVTFTLGHLCCPPISFPLMSSSSWLCIV